jgi:hypothetical protein
MPPEPQPTMQNVWHVSEALENHSFDHALSLLSEKITKKQDECHEMGMLAVITSISHDVSNIYGQGTIISALMTVTVTPLSITGTGSPDHLATENPEPTH